ncbi:MAG: hypothetical protein AAGF59_16190 [Pseudomonadota bacterium]
MHDAKSILNQLLGQTAGSLGQPDSGQNQPGQPAQSGQQGGGLDLNSLISGPGLIVLAGNSVQFHTEFHSAGSRFKQGKNAVAAHFDHPTVERGTGLFKLRHQ